MTELVRYDAAGTVWALTITLWARLKLRWNARADCLKHGASND